MATKEPAQEKTVEKRGEIPANLQQRLLRIMKAVSGIPKNGLNKFHGYKFMRAEDVADEIRSACIEHGVMIVPSCISVERTDGGLSQKGQQQTVTLLCYRFTFINVDDPTDRMDVEHYGESLDSADKGYYRASTGCYKYALIRTFQLGSDDDPENESEEKSTGPVRRASSLPPKPQQHGIGPDAKQPPLYYMIPNPSSEQYLFMTDHGIELGNGFWRVDHPSPSIIKALSKYEVEASSVKLTEKKENV